MDDARKKALKALKREIQIKKSGLKALYYSFNRPHTYDLLIEENEAKIRALEVENARLRSTMSRLPDAIERAERDIKVLERKLSLLETDAETQVTDITSKLVALLGKLPNGSQSLTPQLQQALDKLMKGKNNASNS